MKTGGTDVLILVLESSTTSAKAMLFDPARGAAGTLSRPYSSAASQLKEVGAQDADLVFAETAALGRQICQGKKIDLVATSGTWHSLLVTDGDIRPLTPSFTWAYNGAAAAAERLRAREPFCRAFYQRTGCMVHAIYPAFKLMMLKEQGFSLSGKRLCSQSSYNVFQLTGKTVTSASSSSGSGLLNAGSRGWDQETLAMLGIKEEQLFRLTNYHEPLALNTRGAGLLGLPEGTPVLVNYPDGALNQVGAGALRPGKMTFSVGTSGALRLSASAPRLPEKPSTWCYMSPDAWLIGAATSGACNCLDWYMNFFGGNLRYADLESGDIDRERAPLFLPFLFGERCPGWHDAWTGGFCGLRPDHTPRELYHSIQEGILFNLYQCYQLLSQLGGAPGEIHLSGGILNSPKWMQMCADIFGREMLCSDISNVSMIGAAVLGMKALGCLKDIADYAHVGGERLTPDPAKHAHYARRFAAYMERYGMEQSR